MPTWVKAAATLMQLVTSANIACGFHAGDAVMMRDSVKLALVNGVAIGAHPSFPDRENFGRTAMQLPPDTVYAQVIYQVGLRTRDGSWASVNAQSVCLHGDGEYALAFARLLRAHFAAENITVTAG